MIFVYLIAIILVFLTGYLGSLFSNIGLKEWYKTIALPSWTPPGFVIGIVWTVLYILIIIAAILFLRKSPHNSRFWWIVGIFMFNLFLNAFWSYLFFVKHLLVLAGWEAILMEITIIALILLIWPISKTVSIMLIPYGVWVIFATYLTFTVAGLN